MPANTLRTESECGQKDTDVQSTRVRIRKRQRSKIRMINKRCECVEKSKIARCIQKSSGCSTFWMKNCVCDESVACERKLHKHLVQLAASFVLFCSVLSKDGMHISKCNSLLMHNVHKFRIGIAFDPRSMLYMAKENVFLHFGIMQVRALAHSHNSNILQSFRTTYFHRLCFSSHCKFYTIQLVTVTSKTQSQTCTALKQTNNQANRGVWRPSQPTYLSHLTKIPIL